MELEPEATAGRAPAEHAERADGAGDREGEPGRGELVGRGEGRDPGRAEGEQADGEGGGAERGDGLREGVDGRGPVWRLEREELPEQDQRAEGEGAEGEAHEHALVATERHPPGVA